MKYILIALLAAPLLANSAEFTLDGIVIKSSVVVKEAKCSGYSILVEQDRFPEEVSGHVPEIYGTAGYLGGDADLIVSARAFLKKGSVEQAIPSVIDKYRKAGKILTDDDRVYIPFNAYCLSPNTFLLLMDSGGNCNGCDALIKYKINKNGSISDVGFPSREEHKRVLGY